MRIRNNHRRILVEGASKMNEKKQYFEGWEWFECYKLGLFPDGIYSDPQTIFKKPEDKQ